jgi:outer membrane lipoprotein SlyB
MSWFGKVVGGTLGFSIAGPLGAVIGGVIVDILPARSLTLTNEDSLKELARLSAD